MGDIRGKALLMKRSNFSPGQKRLTTDFTDFTD